MSIYCSRDVYKPKGCGYVLKCLCGDKTYWVHKTYSSIQGLKRALLSGIRYDKTDIVYIYKIPDNTLIAIALPSNNNEYNYYNNVFNLKELSSLNTEEQHNYINKAKSFYEAI